MGNVISVRLCHHAVHLWGIINLFNFHESLSFRFTTKKTYLLFRKWRLLSNRFGVFDRDVSNVLVPRQWRLSFRRLHKSKQLSSADLIFNTRLWYYLLTWQPCSRGTIATTVYYLQLMGCMGFTWHHCHNCTIWTLTLNSVQPISCDKEIAVAIATCEQPLIQVWCIHLNERSKLTFGGYLQWPRPRLRPWTKVTSLQKRFDIGRKKGMNFQLISQYYWKSVVVPGTNQYLENEIFE